MAHSGSYGPDVRLSFARKVRTELSRPLFQSKCYDSALSLVALFGHQQLLITLLNDLTVRLTCDLQSD